MDNNRKYFFVLLTAFLKETVPLKPINIDWQQVYDLANIHFVSGAIYLAVQKLEQKDKPDKAILKRFKTDFFNTMLRYEEQEKAYQEIKKKLNEQKIKHIFFKGSVIRDYYPVKQMRTLGDIDLLLNKKDHEVVKEALFKIGYQNKINTDHLKYLKDNLLIEVHDKLIYRDINKKIECVSYFESVWNNVNVVNNSFTYELKLEYHLIYLLAHIAKHLYSSGCGVRMILDIAVIINKFGDLIDFSYLWQELKKIKLEDFAGNVFELINRWFQVYAPCEVYETIGMDDKSFELICNYILEGGTFGLNDREYSVHIIRREYNKTSNHKLAQFKAFFGKIFLNYKEMTILYPILIKLPFLLPFTWISRGFQFIITKRNRTRTVTILKGLVSNADKAEQSYEVMKKMGLS